MKSRSLTLLCMYLKYASRNKDIMPNVKLFDPKLKEVNVYIRDE